MYPLTKATTQYNFSALENSEDVVENGETDEYIYVDDPKEGNASSAEENVEKEEKSKIQRLSKSAGPAMSYMRAKARRLSKEKRENDSGNISDDNDSCFSLPWRYVPGNIMEELEFFKNADNKLQDQIQKTTQLVFVEKDGKAVAQLKAPINSLFPRELGPQQAARWPADIQVIDRRIKHIPYVPNEPEAFYKITGLEKTPMVRGEERGGRLVFMYEPRSTFFVRSRVGGIRTGPEQCAVSIDRSVNDSTLVFESRFESGNLAKAIQVGEYEYELWLRYDLYTNKHTQWFYFSVSNTRPNVAYRFSIVNFMKPDSLYNYGMKPCMYSERDALQKKIGWRRHGTNIKYYRNNIKYETSRGDRPFYSLTWSTEFSHKGDTVYFSHCFPYTYTDLQDYLLDLSNDPIKSKICKQRVLCRTLAGNLVYLLTITSPSTNPEDIKHKKAVVLTARVHPGESNASWMMKGFLDYLTSSSADAKLLRDTFIFKIVPMLNPDGVIVGNYRCSLAGRDLNRNYKTVLKDAYPTVWHTKQMIRRLLQEREIVAYCDLHGHSRRQNVFIYGCENRHNPERRLRERIFPCMLQKNSPDKFHYEACKFKIQKSKEGTGRVVMWNMGIMNSYTMEATFCGSSLGKKKGYHFTTRDFEEMGYDFCDTLLDYCDPDTTKCANVLYDLEEHLKQEIRTKLQQKGVLLDNVDLSVDDLSQYELESSDGGSDSSVSDGPPVHLQFQPQRVPKKKKKLKSKKERDRLKEGKDTGKKSGDTKDKPTIHLIHNDLMQLNGSTADRPCQKQNAQVRYMQGSPKRPKSQDDRANSETRSVKSGVSSTRDNGEDQQQKRPRKLLETAKCDAEDTQALANDYLENLTAAYLRKGILQNQQEQASRRLQGKGNTGKPSGLPLSMEGLCPHHEQAFAAQLMAQQLQNMTGVVGNSFVRVWKDYLQKHRGLPPKLQPGYTWVADNEMNMEELMGSGVLSSSASQTERRSSRHHILEVSEAQKRQELLQQQQLQVRRPEKSASRQDEKLGGLSSRLRAQIPSATFVNYDTFKISQMNIDKDGKTPDDSVKDEETKEKDLVDEASRREGQGHHKGHKHSGRKSRMGMHDSDDEETKREGPDYVQDPHSHRPPRVKSAKAGGEEINSAIQSIKDLRQSLTLSAANTNLSPTAGNYIKKLLNQELKQTDEDIGEITAKLQLNIDEKQKQYDDLVHLAHSQDGAKSANISSHREDSKIRSAPITSAKEQSNNIKSERSDNSISAQQVKSKTERREVKKPERTEYINNVKNLKPVSNVTSSGENSRLVDAYHLPDSIQHAHNKQEGFRGAKLDVDIGHGKLTKLTKIDSTINGKTELHYSSATDLSQPLVPNGPTNGSKVIKKKSNSTVPRSASSSSSREESDPKSWSEKFEKFMDKDKSESIQRVKSAKNSRQVVGKRFYIQNKYPKRHQPAMNMLKIEGATCTPVTAAPVASSPSPTPRSVTSTQLNPLLGSNRPLGLSRLGVIGKNGGGVNNSNKNIINDNSRP